MAGINIPITADDQASDKISKVGAGAAKALNAVRSAADKAAGSFKIVGFAAGALNQGLELAKKGWELFRAAIVDTVAAALEFRAKNDPVIKQFEQMKRSAELLRAALGDALIPVIQAVAAAFKQVDGTLLGWIQTNRKLIASELLSFLGSAAILLTKGIAGGVLIVSKVWTGWLLIIEGTKAAVNAFFGLALDGISKVLDGMRALGEAFGDTGFVAVIDKAQDAVDGLGDVFKETATEAVDEMFKIQAAQEELEKQTEETAAAVEEAIRRGVTKGQQIIAESIAGTTRTLEEQETALDEAQARADARAEREAERIAKLAELQQANADREIQMLNDVADEEMRLAEEREARNAQTQDAIVSAFQATADALVTSLLDQEASTEDHAKAALKIMLKLVTDIINALAAQAAAGALAQSVSTLGAVGIGVGLAAAGAALSLVNGFAAQFAHGGFVTGGTDNRDSVSILAQRGEFVMSRSDVGGFRKFASRVLGASSGEQLADAGSRAGIAKTKAGDFTQQTTIINRMWVPARAEEMRMSRRQAIGQSKLRKLGMLEGVT